MKGNPSYALYLVTDRGLIGERPLEQAVKEAILGGVTMVQLREKQVSSRFFFEEAKAIQQVTEKYGVPLIINDRVDIALAVNADGVHVGQSDLPASTVRRLIGPEKILGVSAATQAEAQKAEQDGADYLGIGAFFQTDTKPDAHLTTLAELKCIREAVSIPLVVIGGIGEKTVHQFAKTGINGLAVVSAILSAKNISQAARELREQFDRLP